MVFKYIVKFICYFSNFWGFSKLEYQGEEYWIGPENQVLSKLIEE